MRTFLILIVNILLLISCRGQVQPIGKSPLNLESFNFDTQIEKLYPNSEKVNHEGEYYTIPSQQHITSKHVVYENNDAKIPKWIEYRQNGSSASEELAYIFNLKFDEVNVATTLENKIILVSGSANERDKEGINKAVETLTEKYGQSTVSVGHFGYDFNVYTWNLTDRIIK